MHEAKYSGAPVIEIWGSGQQRREFIYSDDLASACVCAMRRYAGNGPLNLGGGGDTSIAELAHAIREVVSFEGELRFDPSKPDGMPFKALDSSELRALGWQPSVAFHDALDRTYRWFLSHDTRLVAET
jgi:GDP-L-fucose synthase